VRITLSLVPSPLTTPLLDGRTAIDGVTVVPNAAKSVDENSRRMLDGDFDVAEMSLGTFVHSVRPDSPLIGLPIFPGRRFVHGGVLVRRGGGIAQPSDLNGRRVVVPQYWLTSSIWHRGTLQHEFGVDLASIDWITVTPERGTATFPSGVRVRHVEGRSMPELLTAGLADAVLTPRPDHPSSQGPGIECLFADLAAAQRAYLSRRGIFPIMHFIVMRRSLVAEASWLPNALCRAFERVEAEVLAAPARRLSLEPPIHGTTVDESVAIFGADPWRYGIEANRPVIETFLAYAHEQGQTPDRRHIDELFVDAAPQSRRAGE
jgi:4,5-dihydroxyphthalate decarboxylase